MSEDEVAESGDQSSPPPRRRPLAILGAVVAVLVVVVAIITVSNSDSAPGATPSADAVAVRPPAPPEFVGRDRTRLLLDGRPFRFTGFNSYVMLGCGDDDEKLTGTARDTFFAGLRPGSVVRVFMLPGTSTTETDALVDTAAKYGQRLVVALTDQQNGCGDNTKKDEAFYADGYRGAYLDWVRTIVPRYRDSTAIAMWELVNEPRADDVGVLRAFFDEAGGLVHQLDPNHLLSAGTALPDGLGGTDGFLQLMSSPAIDVVSLHEYDAVADVSPHLAEVVDVARTVEKPVLVGEWGLYAGGDGAQRTDTDAKCFSVDGRTSVARSKIAAYLDVPEVAGLLYWSYTARGVNPAASDCSYSTTESDPLVSMIRGVDVAAAQG